uniref:Cytidine and deoxycytidylate deaminase zinc-binding region protein n=1 Tax=Megaviridae environmental sample TaxID=1737588 RepID=A0A5J6VLP9_9VIRU|nr:MAG: cytidine and deoxycytidylate deaminase zinc-binding region protein [Megaviridae environmental sample]
MNRLSWDEYFLGVCKLISQRSSCERLNVGCVLVKDNRILSTGYNGFISGAKHISIVKNNHEQCTVHAENNAIADCARRGVSTNGSTAYITHYPCINCFKLLVSSGIKEIKYLEDYKNDETINKMDIDIKITKLI